MRVRTRREEAQLHGCGYFSAENIWLNELQTVKSLRCLFTIVCIFYGAVLIPGSLNVWVYAIFACFHPHTRLPAPARPTTEQEAGIQ
jgi:hypothetical protein